MKMTHNTQRSKFNIFRTRTEHSMFHETGYKLSRMASYTMPDALLPGAMPFIRLILLRQGVEPNPGPILVDFWGFNFGYLSASVIGVLVFTAIVAVTFLILVDSFFRSDDKKTQTGKRTTKKAKLVVHKHSSQPNIDHFNKFDWKFDEVDGQRYERYDVNSGENHTPEVTDENKAEKQEDDKPEVIEDTVPRVKESIPEVIQEAITMTSVNPNMASQDNINIPATDGSNNEEQEAMESDTDSEPVNDVSFDSATLKADLLEYTNNRIKARPKSYIERSGTNAVIATLQQNRIAIITGISGEGKTAVALDVMSKVQEGKVPNIPVKQPLIISNPSEWTSLVGMREHLLVFIDDMFGRSDISHDILHSWREIINDMGIYLKMGNVCLLIASRFHILEKAFSELCPLGIQDDQGASEDDCIIQKSVTINLSHECCLTEKEKCDMLYSYSQNCMELDFNNNDSSDVLSLCQSQNMIGFPKMCFMFFNSKQLYSNGIEFFAHPLKFLSEFVTQVAEQDTESYFALLYCLISEKQMIHRREVDFNTAGSRSKRRMSAAARSCDLHSNDFNKSYVTEALRKITGDFLVYENKRHQFLNSTLMEVAFSVMGSLETGLVLKYCDERLLIENIAIETTNQQFGKHDIAKCFVNKRCFQLLSDRVFKIIKRDITVIPSIECLESPAFLTFFCQHIKSTNRLKELFSIKSEGKSLLEYFANNFTFLAFLLKNGVRDYIVSTTSEKQYKKTLQEALEVALRSGNVMTTKLFLGNGANLAGTSLFDTTLSGQLDLLKYVFPRNKWTTPELQMGVRGSVLSNSCECLKFLHKNGIKFNITILVNAVTNGNTECIEYIMSNYVAKSNDFELVMEVACRRGDEQIITSFLSAGVKPTENCLLELIDHLMQCNSDKPDILKKVLVSRSWSTTELSRTLDVACYSQRAYVCEVLLEHGAICSEHGLLSAVGTGPVGVAKCIALSKPWATEELTRAMDEAALHGHFEIVKLLKGKGASITETTFWNTLGSTNASLDLLEFITWSEEWTKDQLSLALDRLVRIWVTSLKRPACNELYKSLVLHLIKTGAVLTEESTDDINDIDEDFAVEALRSTIGFVSYL